MILKHPSNSVALSPSSGRPPTRSLRPWRAEHRLPGSFVLAHAHDVRGTNQRQPEQSWLLLDAPQQIFRRKLQVLEARVEIGGAFGIEQREQAETVDEAFDLARRHGLF